MPDDETTQPTPPITIKRFKQISQKTKSGYNGISITRTDRPNINQLNSTMVYSGSLVNFQIMQYGNTPGLFHKERCL